MSHYKGGGMLKQQETLSHKIQALLMSEYVNELTKTRNPRAAMHHTQEQLPQGSSLFLNHFEDEALAMIMRLQLILQDVNLYGINLTDQVKDSLEKDKHLSEEEKRKKEEGNLALLSDLAQLRELLKATTETMMTMEDKK